MKPSILLATTLSLFSHLSSAEVYQCKDAQGALVFQGSPCANLKIEATNTANLVWLEMKKMVEAGSEVNTLMGPDVKSILRCEEKSTEYGKQLDQIEVSLEELPSRKFKRMYTAMNYLRECGSCRASSPSYCSKALSKLMEETSILVSYTE